MGQIYDDAQEVYRPFVIDGVPASGPNEPDKTDIIGLFQIIDGLVGGAISAATPYATVAALPASTNSNKIYLVTSDPTVANNGYWQDQGTSNVQLTQLNAFLKGAPGLQSAASTSDMQAGTRNDVSATPLNLAAIGLTPALVSSVSANTLAIPPIRATVGSLKSSDQPQTTNFLAPVGTSAFNTAGVIGIAPPPIISGTHVPVGQTIKKLGGAMIASATAVSVRLTVWKRPITSTGIDSRPGLAPDDVQVDQVTATVSSLSLVVGTRTVAMMSLTAGVPAEDGYCYPHEFQMLDASGNPVQIGWQLCQNSGSITQHERGWYLSASWQNVASPSVLQWYVAYAPSVATIATVARDGVSTNALAIASLSSGVGAIHDQPDTTFNLAASTDWTPGNLNEIAFAMDAGTELEIGRSIKSVKVHLGILNASATNVNAVIYERPLTSPNLDLAPGQVDDVQVASATVPIASTGKAAPTTAVVNTTSGSASVTVVSGTLTAGQIIGGSGIYASNVCKVTTGASAGGTAVLDHASTATASNVTVTLDTLVDATIPVAAPIRAVYTYVVRVFATTAAGAEVVIVTGYLSNSGAQRKRGWYKTSGWVNAGAGLAMGHGASMSATVGSVAQEALELAQQSSGGAGNIRRMFKGLRMTGLRIWGVQAPAATAQSAVTTTETFIEIAQSGKRARLVLANCDTAGTLVISAASVSTRADFNPTDNNNSATWSPVTFNGSAGVTIAASPGPRRPKYAVSDWFNLATLPRTDGRKGGIYAARVTVTNTSNITIPVMGRDTGPDFAGAAARTDGNAVLIRSMAGDFTSDANKAGFTTTTNSGASPVCGVEYEASGYVANLAWGSDSIGQGQSDYIPNDGFGGRLARSLSNPTTGVAYEFSQLSWTGRSTGSSMLAISDFLSVVGPDGTKLHVDAMGVMGGTVNDQGQGDITMTQANMDAMAANRLEAARLLFNNGVVPIFYTWGPYNYSGSSPHTGAYYSSSDSFRQADNAETLSYRNSGAIVFDYAAALFNGGSTDANGQQLPNMSYMTNVVHPSGAGYDACQSAQSQPQFAAAMAAS